jgi:Tfp pilus assembly protein PilV
MRNTKGQSLYEVLLAVAVATLILIAVVSLATVSIRNTSYSRNQTLAARYAQEAVEWLREERDTDWIAFESRAGGVLWCLNSTPPDWGASGGCVNTTIANTPFGREVLLEDTADPEVVQATVTISWEDARGTHVTRTVTRFSNWRK